MLLTVQTRATRTRTNLKLKALRLNAGLSQRGLASRAGLSANTVRLAEHGFKPEPRTQFAIAAVFDLLPLDLWPLEDQ